MGAKKNLSIKHIFLLFIKLYLIIPNNLKKQSIAYSIYVKSSKIPKTAISTAAIKTSTISI